VRHVGGAAEPHVFRLETHDRHRCLGRNPRHAPDDEAVEHDVSGDEHGETVKTADQIARACGVEGRERHPR
jgi:hypothetical protein